MSFESNYLKLRAEREKKTAQPAGDVKSPAGSKKDSFRSSNDSFTSGYLALRNKRESMSIAERAEERVRLLKQQGTSYQTGSILRNSPSSKGYYSPPAFGFGGAGEQLYSNITAMEPVLKEKLSALDTARVSLVQSETDLQTVRGYLEQAREAYIADPSEVNATSYNQIAGAYNLAHDSYSAAFKAYSAAYDDYKPYEEEAINALTLYQLYGDNQQELFDHWRGTIRDAETIQNDIATIDQKIVLQEAADKASAEAASKESIAQYEAQQKEKPWYEKMLGYLGETQDTSLSTAGVTPGTIQTARDEKWKKPSAEMQSLLDAKKLLEEELDWSRYYYYTDYSTADDFEAMSKYVPQEQTDRRALDIILGNYSDDASGWEDPLYEYINGNEEAGAYLSNAGANYYGSDNPLGSIFGRITESKSESQQMDDPEIAIFNYLYATQGKAAAHAYYNYLQKDLNYRQRKADEKQWKLYASEHPGAASVFSVAVSPLKGLSYLGQLSDIVGTGTIDENAGYNKFSYVPSAIRGQVVEQMEAKGNWGKVGSFAYQTGLSMADFLLTTAITGGNSTAALTIMGSGAAADTTLAAKDRGLEDWQAFTLGTVAGIAEALTEKVSLDTLLNADLLKDGALRYVLKNAFAEGSEEVASSTLNLMADVIVSKDRSEWWKSIEAYTAKNMDEDQAFARAMADQALSLGVDFLGGFISGGVMGGGGAVIGNVNTKKIGTELGKLQLSDEDIRAFIDTGLASDPDTASYQLAKEMQAKIETGEELSNNDLARLYKANVLAIQTEEESSDELPTIEEKSYEGEVSAKTLLQQAQADYRAGNITEAEFDAIIDEVMHLEELEDGNSDFSNQPNTVADDIEEPIGLQLPSLETDPKTEQPVLTGPQSVTGTPKNITPAQANDTVLPTGAPLSIADQLRLEQAQNGGTQYESTQRTAAGPAASQYAGGPILRGGASISDGSTERHAGTSTAEQAGVLASSPEQRRSAYADRSRATVARQNYARSLRIEKVSSLDLGLQNGTEARNIQVMPQENWDAEMSQLADRIYNETGKGVTYVMGRIQIRGTGGTVGYARGAITGDRIIVQADHLLIPMEQIADHEAYHAKVDFTDGRLNDEIRRHIVETFSEEQFRQVLDKYIVGLRGVIDVNETHTGAEFEAAVRQIEEEIFADAYAGINAFGAGADQFTGAVNEKMDQLYMGKIRNQDNGTEESTGPPSDRYSFAGENANNADLEALAKAKEMQAAGVAAETIRQQTGWHTGMDGKWRWEIDDSAMRYDSSGDLRGAESAKWAMEDYESARDDLWGHADMDTLEKVRAYNRADIASDDATKQELYDELINGPYAYYCHQYIEAMNQAKTARSAPVGGTLQDYIYHPALFEAYPQLRNVTLRFERMSGGNMGYFNRTDNEIVLNTELRNAPEDTLVHEIQHAIQKAEGFTRGSNEEYWQQRQDGNNAVHVYDAKIQDAQKQVDEIMRQVPENVAEQFRRWSSMDDSSQEAMMLMQELADGPYGRQFNDYFMATWNLDNMKGHNYKRSARDLYQNTAGEIEARDAAARRSLTSDQRRSQEPARGDSYTVFMEDSDELSLQMGDRYSADDVDSHGHSLTPEQQEFYAQSQARDSSGRLLVLYHQTDGDFTIFDTRHPGAGSRDSDTPFGIFLKQTAGDIGLAGKKQMALYANITNPLRAANREDLARQLREISGSYASISDKHKQLDAQYHEKFEQAKKAWRDYIIEWRAANPGANRSALNDDPKFNELFDAEDAVVDEWTAAADLLSTQAKEAITEDLRKAGYDGVFLENDVGSWGRRTDAIIALDPQQVKNISNKMPTSNPDIRYSVDDDAYLEAVNSGDMKTAQRMVDTAAERWGAYRNNDEANEVFRQDGRIRIFYHGTNTGDFTTFDNQLLGSSSGDLGWFGKGFYFAFSHDEASTYGSRVIPAYLRMRNPYDYSQLYKFKGSDKGATEYARFAWVYNITKQFPDIAEGQRVWTYPNDAEEGSAVSWKQLTTWMDRIQNEKHFSVEEVELSNGDTAWELRADPKKESFTTESGETFEWTEYGMKQLFATERDANEPINQIGAYLKNVMGIDSIPRRTIEKIDFSGALQRAGYDGILQSMSGDEAVVFSPEQIKSSEPVTYDDNGNVIPLSKRFSSSNQDIRYSVDDADYQVAIGDLQAELYQLQHQRRSLLEADTAYAAAANNLRYANTFTEKVAARKAMAAAAANINTAAIDQRISDLNEQIREIRNRETRKHREDQEKYSGTKTAGYSTMPDTRLKNLDQDYMKAVQSGDRARMAELVEQAAEAAMPASVVRDKSGRLLKTYHHTGNSFTVFDRNMARTGTEMDGFFFAPDPDSTSEYGSNMITAYLNITKLAMDPKLDRKFNDSGTLLREKLAYQGYDGVARTENGEIYEYMTFDPEQIKSADPVVYDDRGRVVPLSERFNFHNPDIRYSMDDGGQDPAQQKPAAPKKKIRPVAESRPLIAKKDLRNTVMNLFSIPNGQRAEVGTMIDSYAERLIKNGSLTEDDRKAFFDRMYDAGVMVMPAEEYSAFARSHIVDGRIYVSDSVKSDFGDDWADIRRRAFAAGVYLVNDRSAPGIDQWNATLSAEDMLPGLFDSEETDERTILERILQVAEEGKDEHLSLAEYTRRLSQQEGISEDEFLDNMERQLDWALRTFAEKARLEVHLRDRTGRKIAQEREKGAERMTRQQAKEAQRRADERQARKDSARRAKERREMRELQQRTLKQLQWLSKNRNRAPEELQATWDEVLGDIDLYAISAADEMRWSDKHNATWKDLAQMYKDASENDPNFMPSKELQRIVDRLDATKIADMDLGALQDLYKAAIGLRTEFYNRNNVINDEMQRLFAEVYTDAKREIENAPGENSAKKGKVSGWADKFLNLDQLTPMNVLQRMAGWDPDGAFYSMAKQLERGERDTRAYSVKAQKMLQDFLTEHEDWVKKADGQGEDAIWYEVEVPQLLELHMGDKPIFGPTVKVYMTPAQKVHMYLESKNLDNLRHMTGGRTFVNKDLYSQGKRQEALSQGRTIKLAPETVRKLVSDLTPEEMELAQILDRYYNTFATQEINKVSNILYGYDKAMGKNYAPIYTNRNYTKTEFGVFDTTAEGVGNLKGRQYAVNPSYNISAFDAFERHVDQTARFCGMAIPARNWTTLMNWRENNNSTGDVITHKWGEQGKKYIENLITTLQAGDDAKSESVSSIASKLQNNYISAVFGANPSIVLKQLGSIPLAGAYLDARNMPTPAQISKIDRSLISKYTQELEWRTMGYATPETKQLKDNPNWTQTNKAFKFVFGGGAITAMDGWAASTLWPWAENKVRREHPELTVGTKAQIDAGESAFYKKVAEEFEIAVSRSQSVSDEIHQGTLRKSKNPITKAFTMFRSDSAQTYNALRQKIGEAQFYARTGAKDKVQAASKKAVGVVVCALLMNTVWSEAVSFLMALWKNKGKYYRDDEDELTAESVIGEMGRNMMESIMGTVTFGDEIAQLIGNAITGDRRYDLEAPGLEQINEIFNLVQDMLQGNFGRISEAADVVKNGGNLGEYLSDNSGEILGEIKDTATKVATYFGLPVNNVEAYLLGALKWVSPELGTAYDDLFQSIGKSDLAGMEGNALEGRVGRILSDRNVSESDDTAAALAALYEAGYKTAIPSDTPTSISIDGEKHSLGDYQQQAYNTIWGGIVADALDDMVASDSFKEADPKTQAKMLSNLYTYAAEQAKAELFDEYELESGAAKNAAIVAAGATVAECITWNTITSEMRSGEKSAELASWDIPEEAKREIFRCKISDSRKDSIAAFDETGLSFDHFLQAYSMYGQINNEDLKAGMKAVEFSHWVNAQGYTAEQAAVVKDELTYFNMTPANSGRYDEFVGAGMDPKDAYDLNKELNALQPDEGEDDVSSLQKWRISVDFSDNVEDQLVALSAVMTDAQFQKVEIANDFGITPDTYVTLQEIKPRYNADGNGSYKNTEIQAAIEALPGYYTTEQKAALWQLTSGSTSSKNNPYSQQVGNQILEAKKTAKKQTALTSDDTDNDSFSQEILKQLLGRG